MSFLASIRQKLGDFWWYSILLFSAMRSGDLIQAFIGLWLVPHYVPQQELGAILPLMQASSFLGTPLAILLVPFSKFLSTYAARGEYGKVKRLLLDAFVASGVIFVVIFLTARFVMPVFFSRVRVPEGSLGLLILVSGLLSTLSPIFVNAMQALKKFHFVSLVSFLGAPLRLLVLITAMPFRALSGYMLGQASLPFLQIMTTFFGLRKELGPKVKSCPIWREDGMAMIRYTLPIILVTVVGSFCATWNALLYRQRLPEIESAAYYLISRIAEIGTYAGQTFVFVLFPLTAEAVAHSSATWKLLRNSIAGTFLAGLLFTLFLAIAGRFILELIPLWQPYVPYAPELTLLSIQMTLGMLILIFTSYETASNRFSYLYYVIPLALCETGLLATLTGYGFFYGILPDSWIRCMASIHAASLDFFLWYFLVANAIRLLFIAGQLGYRHCRRREAQLLK